MYKLLFRVSGECWCGFELPEKLVDTWRRWTRKILWLSVLLWYLFFFSLNFAHHTEGAKTTFKDKQAELIPLFPFEAGTTSSSWTKISLPKLPGRFCCEKMKQEITTRQICFLVVWPPHFLEIIHPSEYYSVCLRFLFLRTFGAHFNKRD